MKFKIFFGILLFVISTLNITNLSKTDVRDLSLDFLLKQANATEEGGEGGTPQPGKSVAHKTESTETYGKFNASGTWIVLEAGVEGGYTRTITLEYDCCQSGGNNCSSNLRAC